jgi:hypothetical protein
MKTAIQELIERYYLFENGEYKPDAFKKHFAEFYPLHLLKEKNQIVEAYDRGYKACDLDEALEINKTMFSGEGYYEQTYNKNK